MSRTTFAWAAAALAATAVTTVGCLAPAAPGASSVFPAGTASTSQAAGDAARQLAELRVAPRGTMNGYSDAKFPHWSSHGNGCDTREAVLQRDGRDVVTGANCTIKSGTWYSRYDGATWTKSSDVDIDHVVPRANAWVSGASAWTQAQREAFANDLTRPELLTVTDNVNQAKGDRAPEAWKPPLSSAWCGYAADWIAVKHHYQLTVTRAEHDALDTMLATCDEAQR
ncbi:HNH endonuclease family protein [Amycolatopsis thermoflava]|uniref:HNH endonuclease family protein n=1 Tax=Amycolatopsis thermoflava TaxID=84480 RepID=UPI00365E9F44